MNDRDPLPLRAAKFGWRLMGRTRARMVSAPLPRALLKPDAGNEFIRDAIRRGRPCMVSRLGTSESNAVLNHIENLAWKQGGALAKLDAASRGLRNGWDANVKDRLCNNAGFFPADDASVARFAEVFLDRLSMVDALGFWGFVPGERHLFDRCCPGAVPFAAEGLEPFLFENPWSWSLEGKKVLVIHPFAKSIEAQYQKRAFLFHDPRILPQFELRVIRAVQSLAANETGFDSWFDALHWMEEEMGRADFDVCIVGAGAYGLPLCSQAKRLGKIGIHIGGGTQILFGIRGSRWDGMPHISKHFNEHWIRPSESEMISGASKIERGCYW